MIRKALLALLILGILSGVSFSKEKEKWVTGFLNEIGRDYVIVNENKYIIDEDTVVQTVDGKPVELKDITEPVEVKILISGSKLKKMLIIPKPIKR